MADRRRQARDDGLTDAELDAIFAALAQPAQAQPAQPMPPTLTGEENLPPPALPDNLGADYERPESGGSNPLDVLGGMPPEQLRGLGTPEGEAAATAEAAYRRDPLQGAGARPQTPDEAQALDADQRAAAGLTTAASLAVPGGAARTLYGPAVRVMTQPAVAAVRGAANIAGRNPAVTVPAAAITAGTAAPAETQTPDPLQTTRDQITKLRQRQVELEQEGARLTNEGRRFNTLKRDDAAAVKAAQEALQSQGLYLRNSKGKPVTPDGVWGDGMAKAIEDYQARIRTDLDKNRKAQETLGKDLEGQTTRLTALEGGERLREADKNVGPVSRAVRNYGEIIGTAIGLGVGTAGRIGMVRHANQVAEARAAAIEAMMARRMTAVPPRVGRLNEVYRQGGQPAGAPFRPATGTRFGVEPNPDRVPASELFKGPTGIRGQFTGADLSATAGAGAEVAYSEYRRAGANHELEQAQADAQKDPSEFNIQRLTRAIDEAAFWQAMSRMGQAAGASYVITAAKTPRRYPRPDLSQADSELANLNRLISPPPPKPRARTKRK